MSEDLLEGTGIWAEAAAEHEAWEATQPVGSVVVKWNKQEYTLPFSASTTVGELKAYLAEQTGVNVGRQKLVVAGKKWDTDDQKLSELKIPKKVMLIGTREADIIKDPPVVTAEGSGGFSREQVRQRQLWIDRLKILNEELDE